MTPVAPTSSPFRIIELGLMIAGLAGLATISLMEPATSLMHASPWRSVYTITLLTPWLGLIVNLLRNRLWRPPSIAWSIAFAFLIAVVLTSAVLSPFTRIVLWWSAPVLSGVASVLWIHSHLVTDSNGRLRQRLVEGLAVAAGIMVLRSFMPWARDAIQLSAAGMDFSSLMSLRNAHPLGHSNYTAGATLLGLPWLVHAVVVTRGFQRAVWITLSLFALAVLFSTGSRGGILGFAVLLGGGVLALRLSRRNLILATGAALLLGLVFAAGNPRVRAALATADPASAPHASSVQRLAMAEAGWKLGLERPLFGWGLHATPLVYPRVRAQLGGGAENVLQLHNTPLEWWAGLGVAGIIAMGLLVVLAGRDWCNSPTAAVMLAGYAVFALTDYQLDVPIIVAFIAVAGALLMPKPATVSSSKSRGAALGGCLVIGLIVLLGGRRDPTPEMNARALSIATEPTRAAEAIELLQTSLLLNPDQEIAHFNLGWLLVVHDPVGAAGHFRQAAQLVPDKGGVYFGLALASLNQGKPPQTAHFLALECLNNPRFLSSPWWSLEAIAERRFDTLARFEQLLQQTDQRLPANELWRRNQLIALGEVAPWLGRADLTRQSAYRRERTGYPILMRNLDVRPPLDLYDVRESPLPDDAPAMDLPPKGWLPAPLLLQLLSDSSTPSPN
ncbi:O-antigen ligase family protein [Actomonas aquatica]|uniref:O-antigen ligase family protein n=1 Tax=Actomonas aquatica TaxID=2866162 RepID=A0ABZ1C9M4_9BACT|nr:O-antigen ligase family protein [Opitutus sp. WL0086]WRQ88394.1 O-antigen ligase family protein [Opitutus sp. WL0086]